ncbi:hypothetical protein AB0H43_10635 [Hamadaea sp. NPDC050747]|uniref:hypothetical protein n=1 Tax=Hamadaea sp. NPDC050747 TaxID=3155789 RepID=UPI0033DF8448
MNDPTTEGYAATPAEIEGMVRNLCAYALSEPDPMQRYVELTHQQVLFEGMVEAIRRERGRALADLIVAGMPAAQVAAKTNLATEPKVRKLISAAGETDRVKAAARPAKAAKATKAAKPKKAPEPLPPHLAAPSGKRVLTPADLEALGVAPKKRAAPKQPRAKKAAVQKSAS